MTIYNNTFDTTSMTTGEREIMLITKLKYGNCSGDELNAALKELTEMGSPWLAQTASEAPEAPRYTAI